MKRLLRCLLMLVLFNAVFADDAFRVLRDEAEGFAQVLPGKTLVFPEDHQAHSDYRIEWWYLTANLLDQQGEHWGLQWTLFRQALSSQASSGSSWSSNQLWMAHAAVSTPEGHHFEQRFARGGIGQAGVGDIEAEGFFEAWIDDWSWRAEGKSLFPAHLTFSVGDRQVKMQLSTANNWVLNGDRGYSQKSSQGQASYYYSQPNINISGTIDDSTGNHSLSGMAWLDREWSSQPLAKNQRGWDWFSLHLDDGFKLMLYQLRHDDGEHWLSGSWIDDQGQVRHLNKDDIELTPRDIRKINSGEQKTIELPLSWQIKLPGLQRSWQIEALYDQQWMGASFPYWEGVVMVEDQSGEPVGKGYMELTGYE